jgi:molybdenum cofactor guanylyltransferase
MDQPKYMVEVTVEKNSIAGIVLAGGRSRRLGGDKALRQLGPKPLLAHAISRAQPQVAALALSVNTNLASFRIFGLALRTDSVPGFPGPLAGILAGMDWAAEQGIETLASFACDAPFFPVDLVARLAAARDSDNALVACAASGGRAHPVFALWPVSLREDLRPALSELGARKVDAWAAHYPSTTVSFPIAPFDPFFNINTPADLAKAERLLALPGPSDNDGPGV